MNWYWHYGVSYWIVSAGSLLFFALPFFGRMRLSPIAIRVQLVLFGLFALIWSALGLYLWAHMAEGSTTQTLTHLRLIGWGKSFAGGVCAGVLLALLVNGDFYRPR